MKNGKRVLSVFLVVLMFLTAAPLVGFVGLEIAPKAKADSSGQCGDNVYWSFDGSTGVLTISGTGAMKDFGTSTTFQRLDIKSIVIGNSVTSIGNFAFYLCRKMVSVTIGNSVTSIGDYAFSKCYSLTSITIPDSVTSIGDDAFRYCSSLTSVTIGNSVTSIGYRAFAECISLTSVTIPDSVTSIGDSAFERCSNLTSVTILDSVTSIGNFAFGNCTLLESVIIGNSVASIGDDAFHGCSSLTSVTIGNSVTSIGGGEFRYCTVLESVTIPDSVTAMGTNSSSSFYGVFYGCDNLKTVTIGNGLTAISPYTFYSCDQLQSVTIGDNVTSIGDFAFQSCSSLTSITIPDSVTSIGNSAFYNCSSLTSEMIPDSVTSIGDYAFYNCSSLTSVTIPDSVTSIGNGAFYDCSSLTSMTIPSSVMSIGYGTFLSCISLTSVTIPDSVTSIGNSAFYNCSSLTSVTIPDSVTSIGSSAFYKCDALESVTLGNGVTTIGGSAFYGCSALKKIYIFDLAAWVDISGLYNLMSYGNHLLYLNGELLEDAVIPDGVTSICDYAFYGCSSLTNIEIPNSAMSIGERAFYNCRNLTSVTIPDSVTSISDYAFYNCSSLTSVTIPDSVTSISDYAFYGCRSLTGVTIPDSVTSIGNYAFYNCTSLTSVTIGNSVTTIGSEAFSNCTSLTSVTIPDSVTSIGSYAFAYCHALKSVTLGNSVTSIDYCAFAFCAALKSITIPVSVTSIGRSAFYGCSKLADVYYTGTEEQWNSITIGPSNEPLLNATIHFGEEAPEGNSGLTLSLSMAHSAYYYRNSTLYTADGDQVPAVEATVKLTNTPEEGTEGEALENISVKFENTKGFTFGNNATVFTTTVESLEPNGTAEIKVLLVPGRDFDLDLDPTLAIQNLKATATCGDLKADDQKMYGVRPIKNKLKVDCNISAEHFYIFDGVFYQADDYFVEKENQFVMVTVHVQNCLEDESTPIFKSDLQTVLEIKNVDLTASLENSKVFQFNTGNQKDTKLFDLQFGVSHDYQYTIEIDKQKFKDNYYGKEVKDIQDELELTVQGMNVDTVEKTQTILYDAAQGKYPSGYSFDTDRFTFGNFTTEIDSQYFKDIFGDAKGTLIHAAKKNCSLGGVCYGMALSTKSVLEGHPSISVFGKNSLIQLEDKNALYNGLKPSDLIKYAYIYQFNFTDSFREYMGSNYGIELTVAAVKQAISSGKTLPISFFDGAQNANHTVLAIGLLDDNILINDSNVKGNVRILRIDGSTWKYNEAGFEWDNTNAKIWPEEVSEKFYSATENAGNSVAQSVAQPSGNNTYLVIKKNGDILTTQENLLYRFTKTRNGVSEAEESEDLFWYKNDVPLAFENPTDETQTVTVAGDDLILSTNLQPESAVTLDVSEESSAKVDFETKSNDIIQTSFSTFNDDDEEIVITINGTAKDEEVAIKKEDNQIVVTGLSDADVTVLKGDHVIQKEIECTTGTIEIIYDVTEAQTMVVTNGAHQHEYTSTVTTPATCTKPGVMTHTCVDGDDSYTETIPAPGHVDKNNDGKCDSCGTQMTGGDHCKYCGKVHSGAFGWLVKFFHNIFALFKRK